MDLLNAKAKHDFIGSVWKNKDFLQKNGLYEQCQNILKNIDTYDHEWINEISSLMNQSNMNIVDYENIEQELLVEEDFEVLEIRPLRSDGSLKI